MEVGFWGIFALCVWWWFFGVWLGFNLGRLSSR